MRKRDSFIIEKQQDGQQLMLSRGNSLLSNNSFHSIPSGSNKQN